MWCDRPDPDHLHHNYQITRCSPNGSIKGIVLSDSLVGTKLHYYRGRSIPCTTTECAACESGQTPRWKGYFYLFDPKSRRIEIPEITERCFTPLDAYYTEHGTLRGGRVTIRRTKPKKNGPLELWFGEGNFQTADLPNPENLREVLLRMWEAKSDNLHAEAASTYDPTIRDDD